IALKIVPSEFARQRERVEGFGREALAASRLNHPNIVTIYEVNASQPICFIAMELVEGEPVRERIQRGVVPVLEAVKMMLQATSAVSAADAAGIIHRDIKPENIMVRPDGLVTVLDF